MDTDLQARCNWWTSTPAYPLTEPERAELAAEVAVAPEGWWLVISDLAAGSRIDPALTRLSTGPLVALLEHDQRYLEKLVHLADTDDIFATVLWDAVRFMSKPTSAQVVDKVLGLAGAGRIAEACIRYLESQNEADAWALTAVDWVMACSRDQAWLLILKLLELAPTADVLGGLASGELEGFIKRYGNEFIAGIEAEAATNRRLRVALRGTWIGDGELDPEVLGKLDVLRAGESD